MSGANEAFLKIVQQISTEVGGEPDPAEREMVRRIFDAGMTIGQRDENEACAKVLDEYAKNASHLSAATGAVNPAGIVQVVAEQLAAEVRARIKLDS